MAFKFDRESRLHISLGRLFQSFGATKQNALPLSVGSILPLGTSSITFLLDLMRIDLQLIPFG